MEFLPTSKSLTNDFSSESDNDTESDCELVVETPIKKKKPIEKKKPDDIETNGRVFSEFLKNPSFMKGDTLIGDAGTNKSYNIPEISIPKFFNLIENFRIRQFKTRLYEKQGKYSGIMLDFNIAISHGGKSDINDTHYERLGSAVLNILRRFIQFPEDDTDIHIGFTKKQKVTYNIAGDYYADGIKMLIPSIQITRSFKKHIIDTIIEEKTLDEVFKENS